MSADRAVADIVDRRSAVLTSERVERHASVTGHVFGRRPRHDIAVFIDGWTLGRRHIHAALDRAVRRHHGIDSGLIIARDGAATALEGVFGFAVVVRKVPPEIGQTGFKLTLQTRDNAIGFARDVIGADADVLVHAAEGDLIMTDQQRR